VGLLVGLQEGLLLCLLDGLLVGLHVKTVVTGSTHGPGAKIMLSGSTKPPMAVIFFPLEAFRAVTELDEPEF
jgi:hypothetical protein